MELRPFEMRRIASLKPYARNARTHSKGQITKLAARCCQTNVAGLVGGC